MNRYYFGNNVLVESDDCKLVNDLNEITKEYGLTDRKLDCFGISMYDRELTKNCDWSLVDYGSRETELICYNGKVYCRHDGLFHEIDNYMTGDIDGLADYLLDEVIEHFDGSDPSESELNREISNVVDMHGVSDFLNQEEIEALQKEMIKKYINL